MNTEGNNTMGDSEFEYGIRYGLYISREKPDLLARIQDKKPSKDSPFEQGVVLGIAQFKRDRKKQQLEYSRTQSKEGYDKDR